jgi:hypothetical protein
MFRLVDSLYPTGAGTSESLLVVANLFLVPAIAYILPGAQLRYSATQFRSSRTIQVPYLCAIAESPETMLHNQLLAKDCGSRLTSIRI